MKSKNVVMAFAAAAGAAYLLSLPGLRRWYSKWGATQEEIKAKLPGDQYMRQAGSARAVTIHAPVEEVWKWLVQVGQDRAGFYSYTLLENLALAGMRNADRIVPEWQTLKKGDQVRLASRKIYGDFPLLRVLDLEENHYFVLEHWGAFVLREVDRNHTRLIIRSHTEAKSFPARVIDYLFWSPAHFVMERKMMLGIKERAEGHSNATAPRRRTAPEQEIKAESP